MPAVHPAELWRESGRWEDYGDLLLKMARPGREGILLRSPPTKR